jgi:hypothetical protein
VGRVDANDVDLAGWLRLVVVVRSAVVVVMVHVRVAVYLRPAKTSNASINFVHEETMRIEPRLGKTLGEHIVVPVTLLGMAGKCTSVYLEPFVVVDTRAKCAGDEPIRRAMARIEGQVAAHEQQRYVDAKIVSCRAIAFNVGWTVDEPANRPTTRRTNVGDRRIEFDG